jgi:hypothetical protein
MQYLPGAVKVIFTCEEVGKWGSKKRKLSIIFIDPFNIRVNYRNLPV